MPPLPVTSVLAPPGKPRLAKLMPADWAPLRQAELCCACLKRVTEGGGQLATEQNHVRTDTYRPDREKNKRRNGRRELLIDLVCGPSLPGHEETIVWFDSSLFSLLTLTLPFPPAAFILCAVPPARTQHQELTLS